MSSVREVNPAVRWIRAPTSLQSLAARITEEIKQLGVELDVLYCQRLLEEEGVCLGAGCENGQEDPNYHIRSHTYRVVMSEYDLTKEESYEQIRSVEKMVVHPRWKDNCVSCGNDIAMIKLASPVVLNDKVQPSCVPVSGEVSPHDDPCYITGWGRIDSGGPIASKLQQALLPVVGHSVCSSSGWWGNNVKPTMICGGGDIRSGCHGDSGGPLNCRGGDGRWYVQGVNSFVASGKCNADRKPTVFTRTSSFTEWISDTMLQH